MLQRALLPPEILAITYNILSRYNRNLQLISSSPPLNTIPSSPEPLPEPSSALLTAAALSLALAYTTDHPAPQAKDWGTHICADQWSERHVTASKRHILAVLDWRLHDLSSSAAITEGMTSLSLTCTLSSATAPLLATVPETETEEEDLTSSAARPTPSPPTPIDAEPRQGRAPVSDRIQPTTKARQHAPPRIHIASHASTLRAYGHKAPACTPPPPDSAIGGWGTFR